MAQPKKQKNKKINKKLTSWQELKKEIPIRPLPANPMISKYARELMKIALKQEK